MKVVRAIFVNTPVALLGFWFATAVGFTWGFIWSRGRIRNVDGLIVFQELPGWAFNRGGVCVGGVYLTGTNVSPAVLEHEQVHRRQWQKYGMLFPLLYWAAGARAETNRFEVEAGLVRGGYAKRPARATRAPRAAS